MSAELENGRWCTKSRLAARARERGLDPALGIPQIVSYDIGVGALREFPGGWNRFHRVIDKTFGGARGAGFEGNVEDAYGFLCLNFHPGDEIYLFGFSRGAASARGLSRFIDWMGGLLPSRDAYWTPRYFDAFLAGADFQTTRSGIERDLVERRLRQGMAREKAEEAAASLVGTVTPTTIRFLGVWDTVLALGGNRDRLYITPEPARCVEHARQALAIDERRSDFEPRIWERAAHAGQTIEQRWFAGVHSNVGGGYVDDGLGNMALRWILGEARAVGLGLDDDFLKVYRAYAQDKLYSSFGWKYKLLDGIKRKDGTRRIRVSEAGGLTIHPSAFDRLIAVEDADRHPQFELYRPTNLIEFLAEQNDLAAFLSTVPGLPDDFELTEPVRRAIEKAR